MDSLRLWNSINDLTSVTQALTDYVHARVVLLEAFGPSGHERAGVVGEGDSLQEMVRKILVYKPAEQQQPQPDPIPPGIPDPIEEPQPATDSVRPHAPDKSQSNSTNEDLTYYKA